MLKSLFSEAATSSCVDNGLEAHKTMSAPPSRKAIIRFAVSLVTCRQAETRKPLSGCSLMKRLRICCSTGICCPAHSILRLPASASPISFTSPFFSSAVAIRELLEFKILVPGAVCFWVYPTGKWDTLAVKKKSLLSNRLMARNETRHRDNSLPARNCLCDACSQTCCLAQSFGAISLFPGEASAGAAEMPVSCRRLINRLAQIQGFDDALGIQ